MQLPPPFPSPVRCEHLADLLPRFGGSRTVPGATHVRSTYALPENASVELSRFLAQFETLDETPEWIARLPGGRVFGPGAVLSPDGCSIARDVSTDHGKSFDQHWLLTYAKMRPPVRVTGSSAVVAVTLGRGYCHWLLEELPRWLLLDRERSVDTWIAHGSEPFINEALGFGRFHGRRLEAKRYSHFECEELVIPSLVGREGRPTHRVVDLLNAFTAPLIDRAMSWRSERLYITREKAQRRRVTNETELWSHLERRGFVKVRLEELSWAQQVNMFAHAQVVVAPHGAGLANLAFSRAGTRVVELFNPAYVNPCFWRLAALRGLDYRPQVVPMSEPLANDFRANRLDIVADVDEVMRALA